MEWGFETVLMDTAGFNVQESVGDSAQVGELAASAGAQLSQGRRVQRCAGGVSAGESERVGVCGGGGDGG
eukprot:750088-Hanusia_phi.AAC.6